MMRHRPHHRDTVLPEAAGVGYSRTHQTVMNVGDDDPSTYSSGVPRMKNIMMIWFGAMTALNLILLLVFSNSGSWLRPGREYCHSTDGSRNRYNCSRGDLAAFTVTSAISVLYVSYKSFMAWHIDTKTVFSNPKTHEGRVFGYTEVGEEVIAISVTILVWSIFASLPLSEVRGGFMFFHHIIVGLMGYWALRYQYLHYYSVFFIGLTNICYFLLLMIQFEDYFPPKKGSFRHGVSDIVDPLFLIVFIIYRAILWLKTCIHLCEDSFHVIKNGTARQFRPGKTYVLYTFLTVHLVIGFFQVLTATVGLFDVSVGLVGQVFGLGYW